MLSPGFAQADAMSDLVNGASALSGASVARSPLAECLMNRELAGIVKDAIVLAVPIILMINGLESTHQKSLHGRVACATGATCELQQLVRTWDEDKGGWPRDVAVPRRRRHRKALRARPKPKLTVRATDNVALTDRRDRCASDE